MIKIGLTGNIASGKSMLLEYFKNDGIKTLCLDEATHKLYEKREIILALNSVFGTFERKEVAKIVFSDKEKLKKIEEIFYPELEKIMFEFFKKNEAENYTVTAVPMLYESGFDKYFDKVVLITADEDIKIKRLKLRDSMPESTAKMRIKAQQDDKLKIDKADFVIFNNGELNDLRGDYLKLKEALSTL